MNKRELRRERILQEAVNRDLAVTKLVRSSPEDVVSGWCPAITDNLGNAWFECALMPWGADNKWRVSCRGGDDTAYERVSMTEAKARWLFESIRDFVTIRTLKNQHGFRPS